MILPAYLKEALDVSTSSDDAYIIDLEAAAVAFVERETGRYFGALAEATEYLTGTGTPELFLSEPPASIPTTILERTYPGADATTLTASASDGYLLRGTMKLVRKAGLLWALSYEYEATYTRGYAAGDEPADIRKAVTDLVVHWYENRLPVATADQGSAPTPLHAKQTIDHWRRRPWA